jgi:hypothetical protein
MGLLELQRSVGEGEDDVDAQQQPSVSTHLILSPHSSSYTLFDPLHRVS